MGLVVDLLATSWMMRANALFDTPFSAPDFNSLETTQTVR